MFRLTESRPGVVADVVSAHHIWRRAVIVIGTTLALIAALVVGSPAAHAAPVSTAPATITSTVTTAPTLPLTRAIQQSAFDAEMIKLVNQARKQGGLPALKEAKGLTTLAVTWANTMLKENKLYHMPSGLTRAQKSGAANLTTWGENVGRGPIRMSAKQLFDAYWNSPGHRANIMSSKYSYIGMGTVQGASMAYNAMEFTDKVESTATTKKAAKKKSASKYGAKTKLTVTGGTNIRSGPATSYKSLAKVYKGHKLTGQLLKGTNWYYLGSGKYIIKSKVKTTTKKAAASSKYGAKTNLTVLGGTNIRSGPATSYKSLAKVYKGHKLTGQLLKGTNWYYLGSGKYIIKSKVKTAK